MLPRCRDLSNSSNVNLNNVACGIINKTPTHNRSISGLNKTPASTNKSNKTPNKEKTKSLTPSRNTSLSSKASAGDRFIPNRSATQFDLAHYLVTSQNSSQASLASVSPSRLEYQRGMSENLNGGITGPADPNASNNFRILAYQKKPPVSATGLSSHKSVYGHRNTPASVQKKPMRHIPSQPERILDAPEIRDDYYLNLVDWNSNHILAVALGSQIYLWNAITGDTSLLHDLESNDGLYYGSVSWAKQGSYLGTGLSNGKIQLFDTERQTVLRTMPSHTDRIGALSWNEHILTSGGRDGSIRHHDVRQSQHLVSTLTGHTQEVCGLRWSPEGRYLASGGNDNVLNIWPQIPNQHSSQTTPLHTLTEHQAAVKALAWCPWQTSIIASGGGTADRHIRMWNVATGSCIKAVDTCSQVCSIQWNSTYKEIITGHGFPNHELIIWKYPEMNRIAELTGHTSRILHLALSPCSQMVVSAAADESLRIWNCFAEDPKQKSKSNSDVQRGPRKTDGTLARYSIR